MVRRLLSSVPRRQIQRAFLRWIEETTPVQSVWLVPVRRTDRGIECRIAGITSAIKVTLTDEVTVAVMQNGECRDRLACFECRPRRVDGFYSCPLCCETGRAYYADRDAFWRGQLLEPLGSWLEQMASARWLLLYAHPEGTNDMT